jgi:hypothetical protein
LAGTIAPSTEPIAAERVELWGRGVGVAPLRPRLRPEARIAALPSLPPGGRVADAEAGVGEVGANIGRSTRTRPSAKPAAAAATKSTKTTGVASLRREGESTVASGLTGARVGFGRSLGGLEGLGGHGSGSSRRASSAISGGETRISSGLMCPGSRCVFGPPLSSAGSEPLSRTGGSTTGTAAEEAIRRRAIELQGAFRGV